MEPIELGAGRRVRAATAADGPALCRLLREVDMAGEVVMTQERDPDFFALLRLHPGEALTWIAEEPGGELFACGTCVVRPGWLGGRLVPVGYLCDLRIRADRRGTRFLPRTFRAVLDALVREHRCTHYYTAVLDQNEAMRKAYDHGGRRRLAMPRAELMTPYDMVAVHHTGRRPGPEREVVRLSEDDLPELARFLGERQRGRLFGYAVDEEFLRQRLDAWPGLRIGSFFAIREGGRLVACVAPWDSAPVKRTRVHAWRGRMRWIRLAFDAAATLGRFPRLPRPGECLRYAYLTHLEVEGDDPGLARDLLRAAYAELRRGELGFLAAMVPRGSALDGAFAGFRVQRTPMRLLAFRHPGDPDAARDSRTDRPGFEMALH